jgi:hypothetical protein
MPDDDEDYASRGRANLAVGIAAVVLIVAGLLIFWAQNRAQQLQDCVFAGHRDCQPVDQDH